MKKHWRLITAAAVTCVVLAFVVYTVVRVNFFVHSVFSDSTPQTSLLRSYTTLAPLPTALPTTAPAPTAAPGVATTAAPPPTATALAQPTAVPTAITPDSPILAKVKAGQRVTGLIMGYGGVGHDGAYLTDTLMVVSYDPTRNAISMISVPRDLYVQIAYGGYTATGQPKNWHWGKINEAFADVMQADSPAGFDARYNWTSDQTKLDAAANLSRDTVEQVIGVPIDYWAAVNFTGFRKLIDAIGGVDVNVVTAFDDYQYPTNDDADIDASVMHIHFDAGLQHMNGERAIEFSRSRKSVQDGSDFARSKRQMLVMQAVRAKLTQPATLLNLFGIMDALQGNIRTNLTSAEFQDMIGYARSDDGTKQMQGMTFVPNVISTDNFLIGATTADAGDIVYPRDGKSNYKALQAWISGGLAAPDVRRESATIQLFNATGIGGTATSEYATLTAQGLSLNQPLWAAMQPITTILDYSNGKDSATLAQLRALYPDALILSGTATNTSDYTQYKTTGAMFSVILGHDFQSRTRPALGVGGDTSTKPNPAQGQ